jgi:hypothetical protein
MLGGQDPSTLGVIGDGRTYEYVVVLRGDVDRQHDRRFLFLRHEVSWRDGGPPHHEVKGVSRVVYDVTSTAGYDRMGVGRGVSCDRVLLSSSTECD